MTIRYDPMMDLDARLLRRSGGTIQIYLFDARKTMDLPIGEEFLQEWKDANLGDQIKVRLRSKYVADHDLLGDQTYGTGGSGRDR